jgi:hypothetical protein
MDSTKASIPGSWAVSVAITPLGSRVAGARGNKRIRVQSIVQQVSSTNWLKRFTAITVFYSENIGSQDEQ